MGKMTQKKALLKRQLKKLIAVSFMFLDDVRQRVGKHSNFVDLQSVKSILIVEMQGFGDMLAALPAARVLKETFPGAKLTLISQNVALELFESLRFFDEFIPLGLDKKRLGIGDFVRSFPRLRREEYDLLVVPSWCLRHTAVSLVTRCRARIGYLHERSLEMIYHNDYRVESQGLKAEGKATFFRDEHIVTRALKSLAPLGIQNVAGECDLEVSAKARGDVSHLVRSELGLSNKRGLIVIAPGAVWKERRWPLGNWKELIEQLEKKDQFGFAVVGASEEYDMNERLCTGSSTVNLSSRLTLSQLAALIERCVLFIGVDSGPMHLAAALGKPVIALFGPNIPEVSGPKGSLSVVVQKDMDCRPCNQDYCPVSRGKRCMELITPKEVLNAYHSLIARLGDR